MKRFVMLLLAVVLLLAMAGCGQGAEEVSMLVYLEEELTEEAARALGAELSKLPEVTEARFVSGEEAWNAFLESQENPEAFAGVDEEGLRHRFEVTAQTANAEALAERIEEIEGVDEVNLVQEPSWLKRVMWNLTH